MDHGRYGGMQQGWDANSAFEGYGAARQSDFRASGSYGGRRYQGEISPRDPSYARKAYQRGIIERDVHPTHAPGAWSQNRRRGFDDEYPPTRESRKHIDYRDLDDFRNQGNGSFHVVDRFHENPRNFDRYPETDRYRDYEIDRQYRRGPRDDSRSREASRERDRDFGRYSYDSDYERGRKDGSSQRRESRDFERDKRDVSRERDSTYRCHERSRSRGRDERSRSRSPRGWSRGRSQREESYDEDRYYDGDDRRFTSMTPSATVIVKGLSQSTNDEDLYQILAEWGPLQHIRVIKDRNSGISRGFAFIDFPSVEAASNMINSIGESGLVIDGRKLVFDYSKPTSGPSAPTNQERTYGTGFAHNRFSAVPSDWMCTICGCVNFARRIYCFQCNESRTDDAPSADMGGSNPTSVGRRAPESGPTHVLVVRGLDENTDEEMLRYEFSKHAPVKDVRLVRDKFTHVSRGFAFVHFHSVEDATKALEVTNGTALERNGQIIRVAYAKSVHGPGAAPQSSSLAAAAIEAAAFSQQYDAVGWAPKEYIPDENQSIVGSEQNANVEPQKGDSAPQSGFVWDEKSGYYYDAASGFYYDGNTGLYYDGNNGVWYTYDQQTQQYIPCTTDQSNTKTPNESSKEISKTSDNASSKKAVISAPAVTTKSSNEKTSLNDAVQAAAAAAMAAEKKEKERIKEIKLASKSSILANKKKMTNVLAMWNKRNHESQAASSDVAKTKPKSDAFTSKAPSISVDAQTTNIDPQSTPWHMNNSSGGTIKGVIRNSGRGVMNSDSGSAVISSSEANNPVATAAETSVTPFKTDSSALGSYSVPVTSGSGKRRFSEAPVQSTQTTYRDRAAERRSLYGSSSSNRDDRLDLDESNYEHRKGSAADMPFPPGVGGGRPACDAQNYEVITADRAIDESNVGNRMLRNMGWQGLGLGKDGGGIKEPVVANAVDDRSGLGSRQRKVVDPVLEAQAGDSYRTIIHKKAIARFREMS